MSDRLSGDFSGVKMNKSFTGGLSGLMTWQFLNAFELFSP